MSRTNPQFKLRMPPGLRSRVEQAAEAACRSLNAELIVRLEQSFSLEVAANEPQSLPAPATCRRLRLLCVLVQAARTYFQPVCTLRPMPPRASVKGKWHLESGSGLCLRETHATAPAPEILERYSRHWQSNALRSNPRAVLARGLSQ